MIEFENLKREIEELSKAMVINSFDDDFLEIFTRKRIQLIREIMNQEPKSIRDLAIKVERDIKNVFEDLRLLHNFNIIDFEVRGRCKVPVVRKKMIIFRLRRE